MQEPDLCNQKRSTEQLFLSKSITKHVLYYLTCVLSLGVLYILFLWFPDLKKYLYSPASPRDATHILLIDKVQETCVILRLLKKKIQILPFGQPRMTTFFEHKHHLYILKSTQIQSLPEWLFEKTESESKTESECGDQIKHFEGLTEWQAKSLVETYRHNVIDIKMDSVWFLVLKELLSPFTVFQFFSFVVWFNDNYVQYAVIILVLTLASVGATVYEAHKQSKRIQKMAFYTCPVKVKRKKTSSKESETKTINSKDLQIGDLVYVNQNEQVPADILLLKGKCVVDESLITGESTPCTKQKYSESSVISEVNCLIAGTRCLVSENKSLDSAVALEKTNNQALGVVIRTGFYTIKGRLIRDLLFQKTPNPKFKTDAFRFLLVISGITLVAFIWNCVFLMCYYPYKTTLFKVMIRSLDLFTTAIPPTLPLSLMIAIEYSRRRLKHNKIFSLNSEKINDAGRIKLFCFDKTGTLTQNSLTLKSVMYLQAPSHFQEFELTKQSLVTEQMILNQKRASTLSTLFEVMGTCHSLSFYKDQLVGDPLEKTSFTKTRFMIHESNLGRFVSSDLDLDSRNPENFFKILKMINFTSERKKMSVVCLRNTSTRCTTSLEDLSDYDSGKNDVLESPEIVVYSKGAPEKILESCNPETLPTNVKQTLRAKTQQGFRVIAVAMKTISKDKLGQLQSTESIESDLTFVGFLLFENPLKPQTKTTIRSLQSSGIGTVMITGDNLMTALSVSIATGLVQKQKWLFALCWNDEQKYFEVDSVRNPELLPKTRDKITHFEQFDEDVFADQYHKTCESSRKKETRSPKIKSGRICDSLLQGTGSNPDPNDQVLLKFGNRLYDLETFLRKFDHSSFGMTGDSYDSLASRCLAPELLLRIKVFARSNPEQKTRIISEFQKIMNPNSHYVAFCGDGANDCSALKQANVGLSLTQTEASIAAPFNTVQKDISCVLLLIKEGKCCLQLAIETFMFLCFTALTQCFGTVILYSFITNFTDGHYYYFDLFLTFFVLILAPRSRPSRSMTNEYPPSDLFNFPVMLRLLFPLVFSLGFLIFASLLLQRECFFMDVVETLDNDGFYSSDYFLNPNQLVYYMVAWGYVAALFFQFEGKPFKQHVHKNRGFALLVILHILFLACLFFVNDMDIEPKKIGGCWNSIKYYLVYFVNCFFRVHSMSRHYQMFVFVFGLSNFVFLVVFDRLFVSMIISFYIKRKNINCKSVKDELSK